MRNTYAAANYLSCFLSASKKSRKEIANACQMDKPNRLPMMARGVIPIPLDLILPLSSELEFPPEELLSLCLEVYHPKIYALIRERDPSGVVLPDRIDELEVFFRSIPGLDSLLPEIRKIIQEKRDLGEL